MIRMRGRRGNGIFGKKQREETATVLFADKTSAVTHVIVKNP